MPTRDHARNQQKSAQLEDVQSSPDKDPTYQGQVQSLFMCTLHGKKLEAYCLFDRQLLCIDCILSDDHKTQNKGRFERITHEIISIEKAVNLERAVLQEQTK
jgi:hypothetical protein